MNAFHVLGGVLAIWALLVAFLGITREGFPGSRGAETLVGLISVVLVAAAIASAVITAANESEDEDGHSEAALRLSR